MKRMVVPALRRTFDFLTSRRFSGWPGLYHTKVVQDCVQDMISESKRPGRYRTSCVMRLVGAWVCHFVPGLASLSCLVWRTPSPGVSQISAALPL